jgi:hypothetical protein
VVHVRQEDHCGGLGNSERLIKRTVWVFEVLENISKDDGAKRVRLERQRLVGGGNDISRRSEVETDVVAAFGEPVTQPPITAADVEHRSGVATQKLAKHAPA